MHATIRRYEASDKTRTAEIVKKAHDSLLPRMSEMPGFSGYYLIDAGDGVFSLHDGSYDARAARRLSRPMLMAI